MGKKTVKASGISSSTSNTTQRKPLIEISEEEQMRLIEQSGILTKVKAAEKNASLSKEEGVEERIPLSDEIFNAVLYIIPFSFLLLMMEILIHQQYRQRASLQNMLDRMTPGVPIISLLVFYTLRYKHYRTMQLALFVVSVVSSSRMIFLLDRGDWTSNMKQDPPLALLWIHAIVHLELGPAVLSLLTTGSFVWWKGLQLIK